MLLFAVDDEPRHLDHLRRALEEAEPSAIVLAFRRAPDVLRAADTYALRPSVAFLDIHMPDMTGLELAKHLRTRFPETRVIFVTEHPDYALEAFRVHAVGYLTKPCTAGDIREILDETGLREPSKTLLRVRCFGEFEVFWKGEPLIFRRRQSRELFAFLIDRRCASCTANEIITALWEGAGDPLKNRSYVRALISDLRRTLRSVGMEAVLLREHRQVALRREFLDCDYYRLLAGDVTAAAAFHGAYMSQYAWAETTLGELVKSWPASGDSRDFPHRFQ